MSDLDKEKNRIRNLKQNKNKTEEELDSLVNEKLAKKEIINNLTFCINDEEKRLAQDLLETYLEESSIESNADKDTLRQLIDLEILIERIKKIINVESSKANPSLPTQMLQELRDTTDQILKLKESLNLINKDKAQSTFVETWDILKKKAIKYFEEHQGHNTCRCPYCNKLFHLLLKVDNYDAIKSVWFKGTLLYNKPVLELFDNKTISKEKAAEILGCSVYYIDIVYDLYIKEKEGRK